jgi:hypothetical protein
LRRCSPSTDLFFVDEFTMLVDVGDVGHADALVGDQFGELILNWFKRWQKESAGKNLGDHCAFRGLPACCGIS